MLDLEIKSINIKVNPYPSYSEEYDIYEIEGGYRVVKTCGSGMPIGALNDYQIDLNFIQADKMLLKMLNVLDSLDWDKDIDTLEFPFSNWSITTEFKDGTIKKTKGNEFGCKEIEPALKIIKSTIRWIL